MYSGQGWASMGACGHTLNLAHCLSGSRLYWLRNVTRNAGGFLLIVPLGRENSELVFLEVNNKLLFRPYLMYWNLDLYC